MLEPLAIRFAPIVQELPIAAFSSRSLPPELLIAERGELAIYYAPFDHVNTAARVVLVGITRGYHQMQTALLELRRQLNHGTELSMALAAAKKTASISRPMRTNLCDMLDYFEIQKLLGLPSCATLFGEHSDQVHFTSLLRYPVFRAGMNYSGTPDMMRNTLLQSHLLEYFAAEAMMLPSALFVPLGPCVRDTMRNLIERGVLDGDHVLDGLEHPSGANTERIAYLLGRKSREKLSPKTNPLRIDHAREALHGKIGRLFAARGNAERAGADARRE